MPISFRLVRRPHAPRNGRVVAASRLAAVLLFAAVLAACGGEGSGVLAPRTPVQVRTGGASTAADSALVGQWFRLVYFTDSVGLRTSETTWEFRGDGSVTRSVVARLLSSGLTSGVTNGGTWSTSGDSLIVTFLPAGAAGAGGAGAGTVSLIGNPPFGTGGTAIDTVSGSTLRFAFRVDSSATAGGSRTLYLNALPFVFVGPPASSAATP